jgi:uncharacterized protein (DUF2237 family)
MNKNVLGTNLEICSLNPLTGYNRNGYCNYDNYDYGTHIVCAIVTDKFLKFTLSQGNDLITSRNGFRGLKPGDKWCLCVNRWLDAYYNNAAPLIILKATSDSILKYIPLKIVLKNGI